MPPLPDVDRFVVANGIRLHFVEWETTAGGEVVILLHGLRGTCRSWDFVAASLRAVAAVVAVDARGRGGSDWTERYGPRHFVTDLASLLDVLQPSRPTTLCGTSEGGWTAYLYAALNPDKVDRVVLVDVGPELNPTGTRRVMAEGSAGAGGFPNAADATAALRSSALALSDDVIAHLVEHSLRRAPWGRLYWKYDPALVERRAPYDNYDLDERWRLWRALSCPTLIVRGSASDVLTEATADHMLQENPLASLVTVGSGHNVPLEAPEDLATEIRTWILATPIR